MAEQKVELRKIRDFSDNLNDTFLFIRQNLKPLLTTFLGIAGLFMLVAAIVSGIYQSDMSSFFEQIVKGTSQVGNSPYAFINTNYFLVILFSWLSIMAMQVAIVSYMKAYEDNNRETPEFNQVWRTFLSHFLFLFFYSLANLIVLAIGFGLCILPGIFLLVALVPFPSIVIIEGRSYSDAFTRCFTLVKENFWVSLGLYLLVYIIYLFNAGIISAVIGAITSVIYYFTTKYLGSAIGIFTSILNVFSFIFYIIYYVSVVLHYYNLAERVDGTGILRKLDTIGNDSPDFDKIQEQY